MEGLEHRDTVTDFNLPQGTFFDSGMVHVLTTATLDRLHEFYPEGLFAVPRFRPNVVVRPTEVVGVSWRIRGWAEFQATGASRRNRAKTSCGLPSR